MTGLVPSIVFVFMTWLCQIKNVHSYPIIKSNLRWVEWSSREWNLHIMLIFNLIWRSWESACLSGNGWPLLVHFLQHFALHAWNESMSKVWKTYMNHLFNSWCLRSKFLVVLHIFTSLHAYLLYVEAKGVPNVVQKVVFCVERWTLPLI
jgi:hypothetical protein